MITELFNKLFHTAKIAVAKKQGLKPGQKCPRSGQYTNNHNRHQVTSTKGEPMPPAPKGSVWRLTDETRHQVD